MSSARLATRLACYGVLALFVVACSGGEPESPITTTSAVTTTTTPSTTTTTLPPTTTAPLAGQVPDGYELFDGSTDGFLIALPSRWVPLDLTEGDAAALLAELEGVFDPEAIELVRASFGVGYALFALDATGDPNVNVIVVPRGPLDRLQNLEELAPTQIEELLGGTVLSIDQVEVAETEALRVVYEIPFPAGLAEGHQYYVLSEDTVYIITFTSFDPDADRETFAAVVNTFTLIEGS